jgi:transposase-like protein
MNLRVDATYFKRFCVVSYQDNGLNYTQLFRFSDGEHYIEIKEDLENLLKLENSIASITCDGHKSTLKAIQKVMPHVKVQRCLVHIQRMCILWISKKPQSDAGKQLLGLVYQLLKIKSQNDKKDWLKRFYKWKETHQGFLSHRTYYPSGRYGYTHKLLRRSFMVMHRALPNMFHYLDDPKIPHTTNGIEGSFSHLKNHLDVHRGLTEEHRKSFIKWYIFLTNSKQKL